MTHLTRKNLQSRVIIPSFLSWKMVAMMTASTEINSIIEKRLVAETRATNPSPTFDGTLSKFHELFDMQYIRHAHTRQLDLTSFFHSRIPAILTKKSQHLTHHPPVGLCWNNIQHHISACTVICSYRSEMTSRYRDRWILFVALSREPPTTLDDK